MIKALLFGLMTVIAVVIVMPIITSSTKEITDAVTTITTTNPVGSLVTTTTPAYSSAVQGLAGVLPIVLVAVLILGAVAWIGRNGFGFGGGSDEKEEATVKEVKVKTNGVGLVERVEKASAKLLQYQNDLEGLLGIKTGVDNHKYFGLDLTGSTLAINDEDYDWYLTAKQPDENIFKVVGLHKTDASLNAVYVLGTHVVIGTSGPEDKAFLIKVPANRVQNEINVPAGMPVEGRN